MSTFYRWTRTPHSIQVCRLYRRILKEQKNWLSRGHWSEQALHTKNAFLDKRHVNPIQARTLMENAENLLAYWKHPNPIIHPYDKDGVCYQRNAPVPYNLTMPEAFVEWK